MLQNEKSIEAESRLENIEEFLTVTQAFEERSDDKSLIAFLTDLALIADIDSMDEEENAKGSDYVNDNAFRKRTRVPSCLHYWYGGKYFPTFSFIRK